jgi:hypothetical protein
MGRERLCQELVTASDGTDKVKRNVSSLGYRWWSETFASLIISRKKGIK